MLHVVIGHSNDPDSAAAIAEIVEQCQEQLQGHTPQAGILFTAVDFEHDYLLNVINHQFPNLELIGGTTDGEISSRLGFEQDSASLMLFCSDSITIKAGIGYHASQDVTAAAQTAVATALGDRTSEDIVFALTFPDSLTTSAVGIINALGQTLAPNIPIFGGLTADQGQFQKTYQFYKTEVCSDAIPLLLFSGNITFSYGVASGWQPIGKTGKVTKVQHNIVYEIDNRPACEFYYKYLRQLENLIEYPLAVYEDTQLFYLRATSGTSQAEDGSITFFGDIPEGAIVQITEANRSDILSAAEQAMKVAIQNFSTSTQPQGVLYFSCCARRQLLGSRAQEEYEITSACFPFTLPSLGFYTNGEISPLLLSNRQACFHNETFITLLFGEAKAMKPDQDQV